MQIKNKLRACVAQRPSTQHNEPFGTIMQITRQKKKKKKRRLGGIMMIILIVLDTMAPMIWLFKWINVWFSFD